MVANGFDKVIRQTAVIERPCTRRRDRESVAVTTRTVSIINEE